MSPDRKKNPIEKESKSNNASEKSEGQNREQTGGRVSGGGEPLTINLLINEQLKPGPGTVIARQDIVQV